MSQCLQVDSHLCSSSDRFSEAGLKHRASSLRFQEFSPFFENSHRQHCHHNHCLSSQNCQSNSLLLAYLDWLSSARTKLLTFFKQLVGCYCSHRGPSKMTYTQAHCTDIFTYKWLTTRSMSMHILILTMPHSQLFSYNILTQTIRSYDDFISYSLLTVTEDQNMQSHVMTTLVINSNDLTIAVNIELWKH